MSIHFSCELTDLPKTWDEAVAAGLLTKEMAAALVAPTPIALQMRCTDRTYDETMQRWRDHCEQQNQKQEHHPPE